MYKRQVEYLIYGSTPTASLPSSSHLRRWAPERIPANLPGADWSRRSQSRNSTVSQAIVAPCCNRWRTHWAPLWLLFTVLHVHYHIYVFCCRNTELGQQKQIVRFILRLYVSCYGHVKSISQRTTRRNSTRLEMRHYRVAAYRRRQTSSKSRNDDLFYTAVIGQARLSGSSQSRRVTSRLDVTLRLPTPKKTRYLVYSC